MNGRKCEPQVLKVPRGIVMSPPIVGLFCVRGRADSIYDDYYWGSGSGEPASCQIDALALDR